MFENVSEQSMHKVRWFLTIGWLLLIFSLFFDPISPIFTDPSSTWSPFRVDPNKCELVQGQCEWSNSYPIGARFFWAAAVPSVIFIILVHGTELWRRICPLAFISQFPAALGWQRYSRIRDPATGKIRRRIAKVNRNSWLARNQTYFQFTLLYLGLWSRIMFINADRTTLGLFLLSTIGCAILVGYYFGGKSWCHYFCPMAPVQMVFGEPGGLLASQAHTSKRKITQSMCRVSDERGREKSACIACQSSCIDIDSEGSYWQKITQSDRRLVYYAYIGLVIGFYLYFFLYAGNWDYYFSGYWTHENQLADIWKPGFYLFNRASLIPKPVAVHLVLGGFSAVTYFLGVKLEKIYKAYLLRTDQYQGYQHLLHQMFTVCTFVAFNLFFIFGGRPTMNLLPHSVQYCIDTLIVFLSSLWVYKTWNKSYESYKRESLEAKRATKRAIA